ncbi:hypothetical protein MMPV_002692 [Pyropia vietnamensis]
MGRGRPFSHAHARLVAAGIIPSPPWAAAVAAVPPSPPPLRSGVRPPALVFPEDRLRRLAAPHLRAGVSASDDADADVVNLLATDPARRSRLEAAVARVSALMAERGLPEAAAVEAVVTEMADAGGGGNDGVGTPQLSRRGDNDAPSVDGEWAWGRGNGAPSTSTVADADTAREDAEQVAAYLASLRDSQRDVELLHSLARAAAEETDDDAGDLRGA